ncbi:MAG: T9SS type A sorting domain-containing protein [Brumimicrobium sp.]|nr:T9SS type A sorting domain-containing protein [Brumimicrobium sp.]
MKKLLLTVSCLVLSIAANSQTCTGGRFDTEIFAGFDLTSDIIYGNNDQYNGTNTDLLLDVYEPTGDTETNRPLLIFIHGGTFITGSKTAQDVKPLAEMFARKGYVTSSMNYRLGMNNLFTGPDEADASEAVMRATQDARAAVRFFKRSVVENANPYGIDTNHIYLVGSSAGGFTALHLAYLDETSEIPSFIDMTDPSLAGGLEGVSGNAGYTSTVSGIINLAGAIGDTTWIKTGDVPVLSLHGDQDGTVPFGTDMIYVVGSQIMEVDGSESVHFRAENIGLKNCLKAFYGAGHIPHSGNATYTDTTQMYMTQFLLHFICSEAEFCKCNTVDDPTPCHTAGSLSLNEFVMDDNQFDLYPNPSSSNITISSENKIISFRISDINGRIIQTGTPVDQDADLKVDVSSFEKGVYFIHLNAQNQTVQKKFVVK